MTNTDWLADPAGSKPPRWLDLAAGEAMIDRIRTHPKSLITPVVMAIVLIAIGLAAGAYAREQVTYDIDGTDLGATLGWLAPAVLTAAAVVLLLRAVAGWLAHTYTITTARIVERYGIISTGRRTVQTDRITEMSTTRSPTDRLFGAGTVSIEVAGASGIDLRSIPDAAWLHQHLVTLTTRDRHGYSYR